MGRAATPAAAHRRAPRAATLAKKALSIRPRTPRSADALPRPGPQSGGRSGARLTGERGAVDWPATLLGGRPRTLADLQRRPRGARPAELWVIIVDASGSTARGGALTQAKGLLAELVDQAYRQRARLAVLDAQGAEPRWHVQGQKASGQLRRWLDGLGAGGGTPLIRALQLAHEWVQRRQRLKPSEHQRQLILTDGRLRDWPGLSASPCPTLLVDIELAPIRLGRARQLAEALGAEYRHLEDLAPARPQAGW
ncbi:magnesium chelatase [Stutzerimonas nosocomialis]|uniref:Magnesium chelatase n=1 Tax=Stutzerimonas nosocomialis TaxID=1056496 RepID=A0A5R9QDJ5_9GAMM|nr:VWA domain-containing protein [Stutzerimonas nosocomialis]TLX62765.1 magnesium chelatase [Stutzerimonas nosocomialis]